MRIVEMIFGKKKKKFVYDLKNDIEFNEWLEVRKLKG